MLPTVIFASLHHLLVFLVVALLAAEIIMVRPGLDAIAIQRLGLIDRNYGAAFIALVLIGIARVAWFEKGWDYYRASDTFQAKMTLLVLITLASLPPTIRFIRWNRALKRDPSFLPATAQIGSTRRWLWTEAALLALVPVFAAMMARGV